MKKKTVFKKALSAILALMMLFGSLLLVPMTASAADAWDGTSQTKPAGSGTQADPYLISSGAELSYLSLRNYDIFQFEYEAADKTVYITLTDNINMGGKNFAPIDTQLTKYYGTVTKVVTTSNVVTTDAVTTATVTTKTTTVMEDGVTTTSEKTETAKEVANGTVAGTTTDIYGTMKLIAAGVVLEGNGHTISNLKIESENNHAALFSATGDGTEIRNLRLAGADISTTASGKKAAGFIANADGDLTMENCSVDANSRISGLSYIGGMVGGDLGTATGATWTFRYCVNEATLTAGDGNTNVQIVGAGGIVGNIGTKYAKTTTLDYCANRGEIIARSPNPAAGGNCAGGLIGATAAASPYEATLTVSNCYNSGNITANMPGAYVDVEKDGKITQERRGAAYVAGICARVHIGSTAVFENVYDAGKHTIQSFGSSCGIITGWGSADELKKCFINAYGLSENKTNNSCVKTSGTKATILKNGGSDTATYAVHAINVGSNVPAADAFPNMYNSDAVASVDTTIYLCKKSGSTYVYDRTSTIATEIAAIDAVIAAQTVTATSSSIPSGNGTAASPWVISNAAQLTKLSAMLSSTFAVDNNKTDAKGGVALPTSYTGAYTTPKDVTPSTATSNRTEFYIEFAADINMNGVRFTSLGADHYYTYHVNGNGHTISNLSISNDKAALFATAGAGSEFRNLTLSVTSSGARAAALVAVAEVGDMTFYNIRTQGIITTTGTCAGALVAYASASNTTPVTWDVRYCVNEADITAVHYVGGLFGNITGAIHYQVQYCANEGNLATTCTATTCNWDVIGGLLGYAQAGSAVNDSAFSHCYNTGSLTTANTAPKYDTEVGGIIGDLRANSANLSTVSVTYCYDYSDRSIAEDNLRYCTAIAGYMCGAQLADKTIQYCYGAVPTTSEDSYKVLYDTEAKYFIGFWNEPNVNMSDVAVLASQDTAIDSEGNTIESEIARIAGVIENLPTLDISSGAKNLMVRIKLTDPFGFMVITSMSVKGSTLPYADYKTVVDSYGFIFLNSDTAVTVDDILSSNKQVKVSGKRYANTDYFYGVYNKVTASNLDQDVYFVAYAEIDGQLVTSGVRMLNPYDMVSDASDGFIGTQAIPNPFEIDLYAKMKEYNKAFNDFNGGTVQYLNVSTYNIWAACDITNGDAYTPANVFNYMNNNSIDILGMQEVDVLCSRTGESNAPEEIAQMMANDNNVPYYWAFASGLTGYRDGTNSDSYYGNALVSKYPIVSYRAVSLDYYDVNVTSDYRYVNEEGKNEGYTYEQRAILVAEINVDGQLITVLVTHFDLRFDAQQLAAATLVEEAGKSQNPVIAMGDFNVNNTSTYYEQIGNVLHSIYDGIAISADNSYGTMPNRTHPIDHIFYSDGLVQKGLPTIHTNVVTSDHYPVSAVIGIEKKA